MDQKWKLWGLAALLAAVAMVPFVLQRGTLNKVRAEKDQLQGQVQQLSRDLAQARTNAAQATNQQGGPLSRDQLLELMRLRREVTELRKFTNSMAGGIPAAPRSAAAPSTDAIAAALPGAAPAMATNGPPWNFKGFATPNDTVATMIWAMQQGRLDLVLSSATPEVQAQIQQEYPSVEKLKAEANQVVEVKPSPNHPGNENEVYLSMVVHKPEQQVVAEETMQIGGRTIEKGQPYTMGAQISEALLKLQRVGNEWKVAGRAGK